MKLRTTAQFTVQIIDEGQIERAIEAREKSKLTYRDIYMLGVDKVLTDLKK